MPPKTDAPETIAMVATPRDQAQILADLDQAKARLKTLHTQVEADWLKFRKSQDRLDAAKAKWAKDHFGTAEQDEPFPYEACPIHRPDEAMQREFHQLHYAIADLENELLAAQKRFAKRHQTPA